MKKNTPVLKSENGSLILQVSITAIVMLLVIAGGMRAVRTTMQSSNTVATSVASKDFALSLNLALADTQTCMQHLQIPTSGALVDQLLSGTLGNFFPATIVSASGRILAAHPNGLITPPENKDFEVSSLMIKSASQIGRSVGAINGVGGGVALIQYAGTVELRVKRRNEFLGGEELQESFPIILNVSPGASNRIIGCTTRDLYRIAIGPPGGSRKSALECIDRGGTPVPKDGTDYYLCRIPRSALLYCSSINNSVKGPKPEGWQCDAGISTAEVAYAY